MRVPGMRFRGADAWAGVVAAVTMVAALSGCSWRLETPEPEWPSPDAVTITRDQAAAREQAVIDATVVAASSDAELVATELESATAPERLNALGGVYVAFPDATPSPTPTPVGMGVAVVAARDGHFADALVTEDDDLAFLLASAGLSHALIDWYATWSTAEDAAIAEERMLTSTSLPAAGVTPTETEVDAETLADLVVMHDQARYSYEVMAARATEDEREQWLVRRDLHAARASALVALPGVDDRRDAVYVLTSDLTQTGEDRLATAIATEERTGATYAAMLEGAGADLPWLLQAAFDGYAQALAYSAPGEATIPALPGLTVEN